VEEWRGYYVKEVKPEGTMMGQTMEEHLEEVGRRLYAKISEVLRFEVEAITESDCIDFVKDVVFRRTFEGYVLEKRTIYEQIRAKINREVKPAPDEWDRGYNVDFYIQIGSKYIGIQIKPISYRRFVENEKWHEWMRESHQRFEKEKGGKVFVVFSTKEGEKRVIVNQEVLSEIEEEIRRIEGGEGPDS